MEDKEEMAEMAKLVEQAEEKQVEEISLKKSSDVREKPFAKIRANEIPVYQPPEVVFKGVVPDIRLKPSSRVLTDYKQSDLIPFKKISLSQLVRQALETAQE
jgi:hypothetical protein